MRKLLAVFLFAVSTVVIANDNVVNVFEWADYIPQQAIAAFEKKTGIKVNLSEYDSNEDMYAKLKADPHSGYDVIIPSSYYIQRMVHEGMLRKLDHKYIPNRLELNPLLLNKKFDPGNQYSYPYLWGTTGIAVDKRYWNPKTIQRWSDLWQPRFKNQLLLYNDSREVFAMAMIVLGHSINTSNPAYIKQAYHLLQKIMPNVRLFSTDAATNVFADDDVTIGMAESGDVIRASLGNSNLAFIYPKDGFALWQDCFAVPRYAPHYLHALKFINFIESAKIGVMVTEVQGYSSPNMKARRLLPKKLRDNPIMYPSQATLKRGHMEGDVKSARALYMHYWELLKLS
jgi:spermidine/putrescine transport system substrate-binding protein